MIKAEAIHRETVIDILAEAFDQNKSVNFVVKQDKDQKKESEGLWRIPLTFVNHKVKYFYLTI